MKSLELAKQIENYYIDIRRTIHMNPEVAEQEFETQALICSELDKLGIPYQKVGATSTIATIKGKAGEGKTLALRADIDALPMKEETDIEFKSKKDDVAHMCGHDVHTSMLLGAAKLLKAEENNLKGEIRLFFQEGEERFVGAKKIIAAGGMDGVDNVFAMHVIDAYDTGNISIGLEHRMAGADLIEIDWVGVSGHGSSPHMAKDSIHAAAVFTADLQSVITKTINPQDVAVLGVGKFHGGSVANIIAKYTELAITFRYFKDEVQEIIHETMTKHAKNIGDMYGVEADVKITKQVKSVYNDPEFTKFTVDAFMKVNPDGKNIDSAPLMGSEDFSEYTKLAPGAMGWLGIGNKEKDCVYFPHHEKFKVDEDAMKYGVAWFYQVATDYLK